MPHKKIILKQEFDFDFELYGIVSTDADYSICCRIWQNLGYDFILQEEGVLVKKGENVCEYNVYNYNYKEDSVDLFIVSNRCGNNNLIPERSKVDCFLIIRGDMPADEKEILIETIRTFPTVSFIYPINPNDLKSKKYLIL